MWRDTVTKTRERFNPRAPCGARPAEVGEPLGDFAISIHAPIAGRDMGDLRIYRPLYYISTHAPLAGRDADSAKASADAAAFQSPRPLRGATFPISFLRISISNFNPRAPCGARQQKCTNHYAHFCDNRQISDAFAQNAACQGILLLFDAGKPCGFWVRTAQVISAHLCFAL